MTDLRTLFSRARSNVVATPVASPRDQDFARIEAAAAALPTEGPLYEVVVALDALLTAIANLDAPSAGSWIGTQLDPVSEDPDAALSELTGEPVAYALYVSLYRLGQQAHRLTGSVEGMRAVHLKAANRTEDLTADARRRDVLDKAWHGIGDDRGCWMA